MQRNLFLPVVLCAFASVAEGQVTYCKDIGGGKTYCTGGTVIHRSGGTTIIQNPMAPPQTATMPPNPLLQNNALPTLSAPYTGAGTQNALPAAPAPAIAPALTAPQAAPLIVVPAAGSRRVCHQFGTTLVCN